MRNPPPALTAEHRLLARQPDPERVDMLDRVARAAFLAGLGLLAALAVAIVAAWP